MLRINFKGYNYIPVLTLFPFLTYITLHEVGVNVQIALFAALAISVFGEAINRYAFRKKSLSAICLMNIISVSTVLLFWLFMHNYLINENIYQVLYELVIIALTLIFRVASPILAFYYGKTSLHKHALTNFFNSEFIVNFTLAVHLSIVLIYKYLLSDGVITNIGFWNFSLFTFLPSLAIAAIAVYEMVKINLLNKKLTNETWLPILEEKGDVIGRIAQSISAEHGNKHLHPVVRLALICGDKIFLQQRKADDTISPRKYDYPLEKYVYYSHTVEEATETILNKVLGKTAKKQQKKFLLKYVYENDKTKRLIFLYSARVESENLVIRSKELHGKFWTIKQIEDAFADDIFAENFELEFEYLKNMELIGSEEMIGNRMDSEVVTNSIQ